MELIFATNNQHKLLEINVMLQGNFSILSLNDIGFHAEIPEEQDTLEGNALQKASFIYVQTRRNCFADDTGLEVDSLNGQPGVYSARFAGKECNAENNVRKLLQLLQGKSNRKARFRTVIACILNGREFLFEGVVNGHISQAKSGNKGFGYDPIFIPDGYKISFAEMKLEEKNKISHRARAFQKFTDFLKDKK